eukprot:CAMPEP_0171494298 /NCGR_PEP_ID=MMETSP0958-20121227/5456_1 /TAXON_ID=87120 /ORGANISM="Aurantiochytrium limacinum, Strain ATCCMYA-1381" /LENGTH=308 /DNA_ID=CAMNT_0012028049 /DNA_START=283 /DNA_END=1209 /DNA_ORIENTATION=-
MATINKEESKEVVSPTKGYIAFIQKLRGDPTECVEDMREPSFMQQLVAEAFGMVILVTIGLGINTATIICGAQGTGLYAVAIVWGLAVFFAITATVSISGGHLNPAVSFAFAILRPEMFPWWKLIPYIIAQLVGSIIGGLINYGIFGTLINLYERTNNITRGEHGSEITASVFCGFHPNPAFVGESHGYNWAEDQISTGGSFAIEALGTGFLMFCAMVLLDGRNHLKIEGPVIPFGLGLSVTVVVALYGAFDGTSINPARDFGPRLVAAALGWGDIALSTQALSYIFGPMVGAPIGGALYDFLLMRGL